jgi:hypothetical protein
MKTEITIHLINGKYNKEYYTYIANQLHSLHPSKELTYVVEQSDKDRYHLHIGTQLSLKKALKCVKHLEQELQLKLINHPNCVVKEIIDLKKFISYISKQSPPTTLGNAPRYKLSKEQAEGLDAFLATI